jgi:hypothetical protein
MPIDRQILAQVAQQNDLLAFLLTEQARATPRFQEPLRLLGSGYKIYSQHDEDGIIEKISGASAVVIASLSNSASATALKIAQSTAC